MSVPRKLATLTGQWDLGLVLVALILAFALTPVAAHASDGGNFQYFPNRLSPKYKFTELNETTGACYYRIRFGNYGKVAYAQIRCYAGACGGTTIDVWADNGSGIRHFRQGIGSTPGGDACGGYIG